ncbi:hypothetical protein [Marinobacterium rhizophilum]|uniref:DUF805 domain-containing protein n=1 Tax=Marinobacterium rhizophilum TaxID=420402 RepID=A0ABY5HJ87_9GAMM|nr:hypothetical protein [Marinobacterium rhizophilum]UTW12174.1 hypothetical protein KDW95_00320 [Marinobacterium rhizophilum]
MADKIPNPVSYDPKKDVFCCQQKRFGLNYRKRFTSAQDALLYVQQNPASCPLLQPHLLQLNDYHYGHWARQLEVVQRHPRHLAPSRLVWLLHLLALLLCVPLVGAMTGTGRWHPPGWLLSPLQTLADRLSLDWHWRVELPLFWLVLPPVMLLAWTLSRALVRGIRDADLHHGLRIGLLWLLPLLYVALYLLAYVISAWLLRS